MAPGAIRSDSPVRPAWASPGKPHSGPWMRGNSTNSASASGAASANTVSARRRRRRSGGTAPVYWKEICAHSRTITVTLISSAVGIVCE